MKRKMVFMIAEIMCLALPMGVQADCGCGCDNCICNTGIIESEEMSVKEQVIGTWTLSEGTFYIENLVVYAGGSVKGYREDMDMDGSSYVPFTWEIVDDNIFNLTDSSFISSTVYSFFVEENKLISVTDDYEYTKVEENEEDETEDILDKLNEEEKAQVYQIAEEMVAYLEAFNEKNIKECYSILENMENEVGELDETVYEIIYNVGLQEDGTSFFEDLDSRKEVLQEMCINNTMIAIPSYVVSENMFGSTLVNDHGDFAAYNTFFYTASACNNAFDEYKEYISQYATITDEETDSYVATDENGNEMTVTRDTSMTYPDLQIRVPRF